MLVRSTRRLSGRLKIHSFLGAALLAAASLATADEVGQNAAPPQVQKTKVFIFAGQSNMVGRSDPKLMPDEFRQPVPSVRLYVNGGWRELIRPKSREEGVGPEVSAAPLLAAALPDEKIIFVKTAVGGTNLHTQWNPKLKNSLYARMLRDVKAATAGEDVEFAAFFWAQGGGDAKSVADAKAYGKNLANFIAHVRRDLGCPDLPFLISGIGAERPRLSPLMVEVNKGKHEVARTVPNTVLVPSDGLSYMADWSHYDTEGTIEFGKRFVEAWEKNFHKAAANATTPIP